MKKGTIFLFDIYKNFERSQKKDDMLKIEFLGKYLDKDLSSLTSRFKVLDYGKIESRYKNDIISLFDGTSLYSLEYQKISNEIAKSLSSKFIDLKKLSEEQIKSCILE